VDRVPKSFFGILPTARGAMVRHWSIRYSRPNPTCDVRVISGELRSMARTSAVQLNQTSQAAVVVLLAD
jgi:hypothetical protein